MMNVVPQRWLEIDYSRMLNSWSQDWRSFAAEWSCLRINGSVFLFSVPMMMISIGAVFSRLLQSIIEMWHMLEMKMPYFVMHSFCVSSWTQSTSTAANYFASNLIFALLSLAGLKRSQRNGTQFSVPGRRNAKQWALKANVQSKQQIKWTILHAITVFVCRSECFIFFCLSLWLWRRNKNHVWRMHSWHRGRERLGWWTTRENTENLHWIFAIGTRLGGKKRELETARQRLIERKSQHIITMKLTVFRNKKHGKHMAKRRPLKIGNSYEPQQRWP